MIIETPITISILDSLINYNRSFSIWRVPGEEIRFAMQTDNDSEALSSYEELNNKKGFVIAPFCINEEHKIIVIKPDLTELPDKVRPSSIYTSPSKIENNLSPIKTKEETDDIAFGRYEEAYNCFLKALEEDKLSKIVLSRRLSISKKEYISAAKVFFKAVDSYKNSFIYLCNTPETGTWLGSSPEILLSGRKDEWLTVALAGTQPFKSNSSFPTAWDDKNKKEQRVVAEYIKRQLDSLGIQSEESAVYTAKAAALTHLKSEFRFKLPNAFSLGKLIETLHPTPAVCGYPKRESYEFILRNEGYDRSYYSGFIGFIDPTSESDLYVNLRCMKIEKNNNFHLYAGGGLLKTSHLESEWNETEAKMLTIKSLIDNY